MCVCMCVYVCMCVCGWITAHRGRFLMAPGNTENLSKEIQLSDFSHPNCILFPVFPGTIRNRLGVILKANPLKIFNVVKMRFSLSSGCLIYPVF